MTGVATDADGKYSFGGLTAGTYYVVERCPEGWVQTFPNTDKDLATCDYYTIEVTSGFSDTNNDFGNFKLGTKAGMKWEDTNGDGVKNGAETVKSGWTIALIKEKGKAAGLQMSGETAAGPVTGPVTDPDGKYSFGGLTAGTYYVVERCPTGWVQTFPNTDADLA